jgi:hypothetical protein
VRIQKKLPTFGWEHWIIGIIPGYNIHQTDFWLDFLAKMESGTFATSPPQQIKLGFQSVQGQFAEK